MRRGRRPCAGGPKRVAIGLVPPSSVPQDPEAAPLKSEEVRVEDSVTVVASTQSPIDPAAAGASAAPPAPAAKIAPGEFPAVTGYRVLKKLQSSQFADVYVAYKLGPFGALRRAVVKHVPRSHRLHEQQRKMLLDEARAISFLDHPNVVCILDVGEDPVGTYFSLEYVAGHDLGRIFSAARKRGERIPVELAAYICSEVLSGLDYVHGAVDPDGVHLGIIHRDVNPSNVLVASTGHVKLTDFGMVLMQGRLQEMTAQGMVKGKLRYLAPDYISLGRCTTQADVYGVGVMLYELLTGDLAFAAKEGPEIMRQIVKEGLPMDRLSAVNPGIAAITAKATAIDPRNRYASAVEMRRALQAWTTSQRKHACPAALADYLASLPLQNG